MSVILGQPTDIFKSRITCTWLRWFCKLGQYAFNAFCIFCSIFFSFFPIAFCMSSDLVVVLLIKLVKLISYTLPFYIVNCHAQCFFIFSKKKSKLLNIFFQVFTTHDCLTFLSFSPTHIYMLPFYILDCRAVLFPKKNSLIKDVNLESCKSIIRSILCPKSHHIRHS